MRYTECRLAAASPAMLLEDLEADTVGGGVGGWGWPLRIIKGWRAGGEGWGGG